MVFVRAVKGPKFTQDQSQWDEAAELLCEEELSLFTAENEADEKDIAAAISDSRKHAQHFDYIKITQEDLDAAGAKIKQTPGKTTLHHVNARHFEVEGALTMDQAKLIVERVLTRDHRFTRFPEKSVIAHADTLVASHDWQPQQSWLRKK